MPEILGSCSSFARAHCVPGASSTPGPAVDSSRVVRSHRERAANRVGRSPAIDAAVWTDSLSELRHGVASERRHCSFQNELTQIVISRGVKPQPATASRRQYQSRRSPERNRIQLTVSRETRDRFRRAQALLLRHAVPSGGCRRNLRSRRHAPDGPGSNRVRARPSTTVSVERCLQNLPFFWHRGCSIDIQLRSVAILEGRQTTHPPDGGRYLAPDRHVRTVRNPKGTWDS